MSVSTRERNSLLNFKMAIVYQIVTLLLNLISKRVILRCMGAEYLGIQAVFTNIFSFLIFADLGIQSVMCVAFYKPLAENDKERMRALYALFERIFRFFAVIALIIGLMCIAVLPLIVKTDVPNSDVIIYFLLFLLSNVINAAYCTQINIFVADQKKSMVNKWTTIFDSFNLLGGVVIIYLLQDYFLFSVFLLLRAVVYNFFFYCMLKKQYPFIKQKGNNPKQLIDKQERRKIYHSFQDMIVYKFTTMILNNTDNLFISILIGTVYVGFCTNYQFIIMGVAILVKEIFDSISASVGNFMVKENNQKGLAQLFRQVLVISNVCTGVTTVCLWVLLSDFIPIFFGEDIRIGTATFLFLVLNHFITVTMVPVTMLRETGGYFKEIRNICILRAVINIILSLVFGKLFGMAGIFAATTISHLCTTFWYEPGVVYRNIINDKRYYILSKIESIAGTGIGCLIIGYLMCFYKPCGLAGFFLKAIVCFVISIVYFVGLSAIHKTEFTQIRNLVKHMVGKE